MVASASRSRWSTDDAEKRQGRLSMTVVVVVVVVVWSSSQSSAMDSGVPRRVRGEKTKRQGKRPSDAEISLVRSRGGKGQRAGGGEGQERRDSSVCWGMALALGLVAYKLHAEELRERFWSAVGTRGVAAGQLDVQRLGHSGSRVGPPAFAFGMCPGEPGVCVLNFWGGLSGGRPPTSPANQNFDTASQRLTEQGRSRDRYAMSAPSFFALKADGNYLRGREEAQKGIQHQQQGSQPASTARCGGDPFFLLRHGRRRGQLADCREDGSWLGRRPRTLNGVGNHSLHKFAATPWTHPSSPRLHGTHFTASRHESGAPLGISWDRSASS